MRSRWTNLILHTSALIYKKKQSLFVSHEWKSIFEVFIVIILELFLAIISLPLYLTSKSADIGGVIQYKIRRILTLTSFTVISIIWITKLLIIVFTPLYFDLTPYQISPNVTEQSQATTQEFVLPKIYNAEINNSLELPIIEEFKKTNKGHLLLTGVVNKGTKVIINVGNLERGKAESVKTYISDVDKNGEWFVATSANNFHLLPGQYWLQLLTFDDDTEMKSPISEIKYFEITQDWQDILVSSLDKILNYLAITFLIFGMASILLLL